MYDEFQRRIAVGMKVESLDGRSLGRVKRVHGDTFEIEKGVFFNRDYAAAFDEILRIEDRAVVLSVSKDAMDAMRAPDENGTSLRDRAAGAFHHAGMVIRDAIHAVRW
ncbi:MAG TPA: hypothetical protein VHB21_27640 [Minicystis sp.]|nr:hypothetical protein [Minicystis sp.]